MNPIIKISNISKLYRLGTVGTGTVSNDMKRWLYRIRGKEDPFLKIGETNIRSIRKESDYVWALKNISFNVFPGEVLGIIGKNGAGKSTLLKILSRVTGPTTGRIDFNGRIGSLLEVGTGFHPELTGRENIFLNGAILGMTKAEIKSKLDEIVQFSGCERYIDTPVKRYSSGMTVRLGFAVAAHLEPEILVVDEVLAVGDAEFQKKAIGKMQDVSQRYGRTVLFVSHNMGAIKSLCTRTIVLKNGQVTFNGNTLEGINNYLSSDSIKYIELGSRQDREGKGQIRIENYQILSTQEEIIENVLCGQSFNIRFYYSCANTEELNNGILVGITIKDQYDSPVSLHHSRLNHNTFKNISNKGFFNLKIHEISLSPDTYNISVTIMDISGSEYIDKITNAFKLNIQKGTYFNMIEIPPSGHGYALLNAEWKHQILI